MALDAYLGAVGYAIARQDGPRLEELLEINNSDARQAAAQGSGRDRGEWLPVPECRRSLRAALGSPSVWEDYLPLHCAALRAMAAGAPGEAYAALDKALPHFTRVFREDSGTWLIRPMYGYVHALYVVAVAADGSAAQAARKSPALENCGSQLMKCFAVVMQATGNKAKKMAVLEVVLTLFKVYFRINTLRLCKNLINAVQSPQCPPFETFPVSQRVAYKFYTGRLAIFDEQHAEANEALTYAMEHCHVAAQGNKRRILHYLVPVRMALGLLPSPELLEDYSLQVYAPLAKAIRAGAVGELEAHLAAHQYEFIQAGTYLLLESLKQGTLRRLFKRVALLHREAEPAKASQVPLDKFRRALAWQGMDLDMDEVECIVANLIASRMVKGYLSHRARVAVISKADPFPALTAVPALGLI